jgi:hypothetical protein
MATLTAEQLTSGKSLTFEVVPVEELGGDVRVYELAPRQRIAFAKWIKSVVPTGTDPDKVDPLDIADFRERLLVLALRDDDGKPLFPCHGDPADLFKGLAESIVLLGDTLSDEVLTRLADAARMVSGLGDDTIEAKADELPNSPDASAS